MKRLLPVAAAALALTGIATTAQAATQLGEYFSFSGFGTLGAVQTDTAQGTFGKDRQIGGADKSANFEVDSNLGLQLTGTATSWLDATVQALAAKRSSKEDVEARIEWAYATVKPIDGLRVRLGRMAGPVFAVSDSRNVGYANTWVRAPNEVYALNFFNTYDGVDASYRQDLGPVAITGSLVAGKTTAWKSLSLAAEGKKLKGLSLQLEYEWLTLRASKFEMKVDLPAIGIRGTPYSFTGFGASVDYGNLIAQAEFVQRRVDSVTGSQSANADGWYVMGGYRLGTVVPYAIVSDTKPKIEQRNFEYITARQNTKALGLRWDAFSAAALKVQVDRITTDGTKGASFTTAPVPGPGIPGRQRLSSGLTRPVTVLSLTLDYAF